MTLSMRNKAAAPNSAEAILASLGYPDPLVAAREHGRMILLGRQARYQAAMQELASKWGCTLETMRIRYQRAGTEDPAADDDYLQWQWYSDALARVAAQLKTLAEA